MIILFGILIIIGLTVLVAPFIFLFTYDKLSLKNKENVKDWLHNVFDDDDLFDE